MMLHVLINCLFYEIINMKTVLLLILPLINSVCLVPEIPADPRIIKGDISKPTDFPFLVLITFNYKKSEPIVTGIAINNDSVLTLASAMYYNWGGILPPVILQIVSYDNEFDVKEIIFHPDFNEKTGQNNVAILKVDKPILRSSDKKIDFAKTENIKNNYTAKVIGVHNGNMKTVDIILKSCPGILDLSEDIFCANLKNENLLICERDLGVPVLIDENVFGLIYWSNTCENIISRNILIVNMAYHKNWIFEIANITSCAFSNFHPLFIPVFFSILLGNV